jgi:DNA-binding MarR family transcriptional regulator
MEETGTLRRVAGEGRVPVAGNAFLLAQLGAHATGRYAERVAKLDLSPAHTGVLRLAAQRPGLSQQALATMLGVLPSKVVALVDDLEGKHLLERRRSPTDRRHHELHLTDQGERILGEIRKAARDHELDITSALTDEERRQLLALLTKIADRQGLTPGVHPGYRDLGGKR